VSILLFDDPACVFIRIGKTGSTSVVKGLFGGARNAAIISTDGRWQKEFEGFFTFAFVRNPFDRLCSCLRMFRQAPARDENDAQMRRSLTLDVLMDILEEPPSREEIGLRTKIRGHSLPMSTPGLHLDRCDFLGRFESFERDYRQLASRLGIVVAAVPHERSTGSQDYRTLFSPAQRARAERIYTEDLARFGYRFDA